MNTFCPGARKTCTFCSEKIRKWNHILKCKETPIEIRIVKNDLCEKLEELETGYTPDKLIEDKNFIIL